MRTTDTAGSSPAASGAVSGLSDRPGDVNSTKGRSTRATPTTPGIRTSTTATRTTTTRTTASGSGRPQMRANSMPAFLSTMSWRRTSTAASTSATPPPASEFERDRGAISARSTTNSAVGTYRPGRSICFIIRRPKLREVWAADYRDRVVHHLLYLKIAKRFERSFIADSCACIPGRGTLYAARRLEAKIRTITRELDQPAHYLKCDIANFFVSDRQAASCTRQLAAQGPGAVLAAARRGDPFP